MNAQHQPRSFRGRGGGADSHKSAVEYFAKKLQNNPQSVRANQGMAALMLREQKVDEAMDHYATAAMAAPSDIIIRNDYAIALSKTGSKRDGVEVMRSALQLDVDNPGLRNNMSALLSRKGDYSEALIHAVRAVQLRPELPIHHKNIAQIHSIRGDTEAALKHNLEAMQLEDKWGVAVPDTKVYRRAAVQLLERGHDKEQALGLIQRSRLIEGKKFVCESTERSQELLTKLHKRIDEAGQMQRDAAERDRALKAASDAAMRQSIEGAIAKPVALKPNQIKR